VPHRAWHWATRKCTMPKLVEALVQPLFLFYMLRWDVACWIWPLNLDLLFRTMAVHICCMKEMNRTRLWMNRTGLLKVLSIQFCLFIVL
jgi:hypothetical protein